MGLFEMWVARPETIAAGARATHSEDMISASFLLASVSDGLSVAGFYLSPVLLGIIAIIVILNGQIVGRVIAAVLLVAAVSWLLAADEETIASTFSSLGDWFGSLIGQGGD